MTYKRKPPPYKQLAAIGSSLPTTDWATGYSGLGLTTPTDYYLDIGWTPSAMPGNTTLGRTAYLATDPNWEGVPNWAKTGKDTGFDSPTGKGTGFGSPTDDTGFGWNLDTMKVGVDALSAVGGLYNAYQSNKLAKEQFAFTKEVTNTNLNNQIKTYNTTLEDRALARGRLNGEADPSAYAAAYTDKNKISRG